MNRQDLSDLRDFLSKSLGGVPPTSTWDAKRDDFWDFASRWVKRSSAERLVKEIRLSDVRTQRSAEADTATVYKWKLRLAFRNQSGKSLFILSGRWEMSEESVALQGVVEPLKWQIDGKGAEELSIHVPSGRTFHTWIGLAASVSDAEVLRRCAKRQLGSLVLIIKIMDEEIVHRIPL